MGRFFAILTAGRKQTLKLLTLAAIGSMTQHACSGPSKSLNHVCDLMRVDNAKQHIPYRPSAILFKDKWPSSDGFSYDPDLDCMYNFCEVLYNKFSITPLFEYGANDIPRQTSADTERGVETQETPSDYWPERIKFPGTYAAKYYPRAYCDKASQEEKIFVTITSSGYCVKLQKIDIATMPHFTVISYYESYSRSISAYNSDIFDGVGKFVAQIRSAEHPFGEGPSIQTCSAGSGTSSNEIKNTMNRLLTEARNSNGH